VDKQGERALDELELARLQSEAELVMEGWPRPDGEAIRVAKYRRRRPVRFKPEPERSG